MSQTDAAKDLPNIGVQMTRADLGNLPHAPLPPGFRVRPFADGADPALWVAIIRGGETFFTIEDDLWERAFGFDLPAARERVFFVETDTGEPVGTVAAWYGSDEKAEWGRIHWITMLPAYQGQGIGKAALAYALRRLAELGHQAVYLETSTARLPALQMYLRFGFVPAYDRPDARDAWSAVAPHLNHPALSGEK